MFFFFRITTFVSLGSSGNFKIETFSIQIKPKFLNVQFSIDEKFHFFCWHLLEYFQMIQLFILTSPSSLLLANMEIHFSTSSFITNTSTFMYTTSIRTQYSLNLHKWIFQVTVHQICILNGSSQLIIVHLRLDNLYCDHLFISKYKYTWHFHFGLPVWSNWETLLNSSLTKLAVK